MGAMGAGGQAILIKFSQKCYYCHLKLKRILSTLCLNRPEIIEIVIIFNKIYYFEKISIINFFFFN